MAEEERGPRSGALDVLLGQRLRERRRAIGLTQMELASRVGVTFQQIQKYENGKNRVTAPTLLKLSRALERPVSTFLRDLDGPSGATQAQDDEQQLLEDFASIESPETRAAVLRIVARLAGR